MINFTPMPIFNKSQHAALSVLISVFICCALSYFTIYYLSNYGMLLFVFIPLLLGFLPGYILGKLEPLSKVKAFRLAAINLGVMYILALVTLMEGAICLLMALPIVLLFAFCGALILKGLHSKTWNGNTGTIASIIVLAFVFFGFDSIQKDRHFSVSSEIIIAAPIQSVWLNVIQFDTINPPGELLFKAGIAYPTHASIEGDTVGAIRYCTFTTGSFVEPITVWNEPVHLAFDVTKQPAPMTEMNPFGDIHPKHLDGYFKSERGEFKLEKISDTQTKLIGTTWYSLDFKPHFYWAAWTDAIIHKIHLRVLEHIKQESE